MRPLVLVTYRDRPTHLSCFRLYMKEHYPDMTIAVIEQDDIRPWNKGLLFNTGYKELAKDYDYIIQHDVDFIPVAGKVDYGPCDVPTMVAGEASQFDYRVIYPQFFGGVIVLSKEHYELTNGFSNQFKGYGGEDDLQYRSFLDKGIKPAVKMGRFECFAHPRPKRADHYQHNLQVLGKGRDFNEGLSTAQYTITDTTIDNNYIHIKITT